MQKKTWKRPKLLILVRGKPEELVLATCKILGASGPDNNNNGCMYPPYFACVAECSEVGSS